MATTRNTYNGQLFVDKSDPQVIDWAKKNGVSAEAVNSNPKLREQYSAYVSDPATYKSYTEYKKAQTAIGGGRKDANGNLVGAAGEPILDQVGYTTIATGGGGGGGMGQKAAIDDLQQKYDNILAGGSTVRSDGTLSPVANAYEQPKVDADGKPLKNAFISIIDPATGQLRKEYQLGNSLDRSGVDAFRKEALRTGPSTWASLEKTKQTDELAKNSGAQSALARSQMAMQGGLTGGASERIGQKSALQSLMGQQTISRDIAGQDETNRLGMLQALPGMDLQVAGYDDGVTKYNTGNALNEILQKRGYDSNAYNEAMKAWGADKTSQAAPSGGKK